MLDVDDFDSPKSPVIAITRYFDESFEKVDPVKEESMSKSMAVINQEPIAKRFGQRKTTKLSVFGK